ncbi:MAG: hypothetical protein OXF05_08150, partial [Hyphomicrobiales bacterium]|nr:hypothetical protein [Hyphomicrobiales bacterium]
AAGVEPNGIVKDIAIATVAKRNTLIWGLLGLKTTIGVILLIRSARVKVFRKIIEIAQIFFSPID